MSFDSYFEKALAVPKNCAGAGILDKDGNILAQKEFEMSASEAKTLAEQFNEPSMCFAHGVKYDGKEFHCLRADSSSIYARKQVNGLIASKAGGKKGNVIVVCFYDRNQKVEAVTATVEAVARHLAPFAPGGDVPEAIDAPELVQPAPAPKPKKPISVPKTEAKTEKGDSKLPAREITKAQAAEEQQQFDGIATKKPEGDEAQEKVLSLERCAKCNDFITEGWAKSEGKFYHSSCLVCTGPCGKPLEGEFYLHDVNPVCKPCHMSMLTCATCGKGLEDTYIIREENGKNLLYHEGDCLPLATCHACQKKIEGKTMTAGDLSFHEACWTCTGCKKPLEETFFKKPEDDKGMYCGACVADRVIGGTQETKTCDACDKDIVGQFVRWNNQVLHHECLKCCRCSAALKVSDTIYVDDNKPVCEKCANQ